MMVEIGGTGRYAEEVVAESLRTGRSSHVRRGASTFEVNVHGGGRHSFAGQLKGGKGGAHLTNTLVKVFIGDSGSDVRIKVIFLDVSLHLLDLILVGDHDSWDFDRGGLGFNLAGKLSEIIS
ncbi:hypothetical protein HS088_TW07G01272 [Tripterygium wilfordii]|uniref:Uncharacterized protein n=1 Tax=Tripterygium wilfordii TaxID=458696 RepID=A0A7J7DH29_TRIWF|nr:hypothetical protein HS088_TW07G01272 [Tripterygium wilfordii]